MKPKPQKNQGKSNKKPTANHGKAGHNKKPDYKQKFKSKKPATVSITIVYKQQAGNIFYFFLQENKPNKPEIRKMIRQKKAAEAEAERQKIKQEKEERIKAYKKQRLEKTKAISKRTQRGQPLMKDRMQLLLKQIEEMKRH
ncbi:hypothetical protein KR093_008918 [Drosophila rubida]|uniref:Thyroid transcription factor 1-associated protein 26 n=1 Tax=Drosophila rubida TaxID=30044 RepID=A0AAD4JW72_9MUSC|nr:hypothetical protein KR093_008918 [Drosophila rubida]